MPSESRTAPPSKPPLRVLVVVPVYNHAQTLRSVVQGALRMHPDVLVVDDGSTDMPRTVTDDHPLSGLPVSCIRLPENQGKGAAIREAAKAAAGMDMTHILTIDADGQHDPQDIPAFLRAAAETPAALIVGERDFSAPGIPGASRFGRSFSNFWYKVHTGEETKDVQSGFRLYPLALLSTLHCTENRYSFETEVLVRASWAGFSVRNIPVRVYYPSKKERISHFRPLMDNLRISLLNTRLTIRSIMPIPQKKFDTDSDGRITVLHPMRSLRLLLAHSATPRNLALAAAVGMAVGTLPLIGFHSILILLLCGTWKLNKICGLAVSQLCMPPFVPALCIETGHYLRYGNFLTEISLQTLGYEAPARLLEWAMGSLILAPLFAGTCGLAVFALALLVQKNLREETSARDRQAAQQKAGPRWSSRSLASDLYHRVFYRLIRVAGRYGGYTLLFFVVFRYTLSPSVYRRSAPYLKRRFPGARPISLLLHTWKLQWTFGRCLVDRATAGISGNFAVEGGLGKDFCTLVEEGRGAIVLSAHTGCWQISPGILARLLNRPVSVLAHKEEGDVDKQDFEHAGNRPPYGIIHASDGPFAAVDLAARLSRGEVLCMMGDRVLSSSEPAARVPFLGSPAPLPLAAYRLASATGSPLAVVFSTRTGPGKGCFFQAGRIHVAKGMGKDVRAYAEAAGEYARMLEEYTRRHPYQFFNFFNFWE